MQPLKHSTLAGFVLLLSLFCPLQIFAIDSTPPTKNFSKKSVRSFKTFLPKPGTKIQSPLGQVVQVLLDKQDKGDFESYMVQVLFYGKPVTNHFELFSDRIVVDFYDAGKSSMRLAKIRGGIVDGSTLEEFYFTDVEGESQVVKKLVRLTIFLKKKVVGLKIRDTLDRTLIHFQLPKH